MLLLEKPDLSKQHTRRFPAASIEQAFLIRRARVSGCLAEMIQWIQARRALGVMSDHNVRAFGAAAARAFFRSGGTSGSVSFPAGAISSVTMSPASAPADLLSFRSTLSQWLFWPSGSSAAWKGKPLMVPSIVVMPREGSLALAFFGTMRKVQEPSFSLSAGRRSFALKRILEAVLVICLVSLTDADQATVDSRI